MSGRGLAILTLMAALGQTTALFAQDPSNSQIDPNRGAATAASAPLTSEYDADLLAELPLSDSLFALFETLQPSIISDRFSSGGLNSGQPARLGGFLSSWTQTVFRVDGVSITDPAGSGMPLVVPSLSLWQRVAARTGMAGAESSATGLSVDLTPQAPTDRWVRTVEGATSHGGLAGGDPSAGVPPIARLDGYDRGLVTASGPLIRDRLGALFAGSWSRGSQFDRAASASTAESVDATLLSGFSSFVFTPNPGDRIRAVGWIQRNEYPFELRSAFGQPQSRATDTAAHVQAVWERRRPDMLPWRAAASYSRRLRDPNLDARRGAIVERLVEGPVPQVASLARQTVRQWSLSARLGDVSLDRPGRHHLEGGIEAIGGGANAAFLPVGLVGEQVNGVPARVWQFSTPGAKSERRNVTVGAYVADRLALGSRTIVDAGLRFESATGSAAGAASDIAWRSLLPRARLTWRLTESWQLGLFGGYARSMRRLALDDLAVGDPAAPTADVFRWTGAAGTAPGTSGARVARSGPGSGSGSGDNTPFSAIADDLKAPTTDEYVLGIQAQPRAGVVLRVSGVARREHDQLALVNIGVGAAGYDTFTVQDPGGDVLSTEDDQILTIYNRRPSSFGADRYLLTTSPLANATFEGIEISLQVKLGRVAVMGGGTAGQAKASAASRGFGPLENDQTVIGELLADPNAATLARGRLFTDRAYTGKLATMIRLPADVRLGAIARYQDGQPFSRVLVFPNLNQGAEAVRAFGNGVSRFKYIATLDTRLQKALTVRGTRVNLFLDAYNLLNMSSSVEEDVAEAPDVRVPTAIQPTRSFQIGARFGF